MGGARRLERCRICSLGVWLLGGLCRRLGGSCLRLCFGVFFEVLMGLVDLVELEGRFVGGGG